MKKCFFLIIIISIITGCSERTEDFKIVNSDIEFLVDGNFKIINQEESETSNSYVFQKLDLVSGNLVNMQVASFKKPSLFREDMIDAMIESTDMSSDLFVNMMDPVNYQDTKAAPISINGFDGCILNAFGKDKTHNVLDLHVEIVWLEGCDSFICVKILSESQNLGYAQYLLESIKCSSQISTIP